MNAAALFCFVFKHFFFCEYGRSGIECVYLSLFIFFWKGLNRGWRSSLRRDRGGNVLFVTWFVWFGTRSPLTTGLLIFNPSRNLSAGRCRDAPFRCDTACSSSLVAADAALSSLRRGTSEAAAWYRVNSVAVFVSLEWMAFLNHGILKWLNGLWRN